MKTIKIITTIFFIASAFTAGFAQSEYDDMYFTGKDREMKVVKKEKANNQEEVYAYNSDYSKKKKSSQTAYVNPTDSYSARNLNPEYVARTNSKEGQVSDEYFASNYQYVNPTANNLNSFNNNLNSWYGNSWYNAAYFSPSINSWNSPYYNSYYDPYYSSYRNPSPWSDPYYRSGWSSSFSYHWGASYNYGWGANTGYSYGNPYYNNAWCPSNGYNNYGYGSTVIVANNGYDNTPNYGKRSTRSSATTTHPTTTSRDRTAYVPDTNKGTYGGGRTTSSGRSSVSASTGSTSQSAYYNRSWRRDAQNASTSNSYSNGSSFNNSNGTNSRSSYNGGGSNSRSSYDNGSSSRSSYNSGGSSNSGGSRSSGGSSSSSGSRSSGSSSGSSSSGSRSSRGNN